MKRAGAFCVGTVCLVFLAGASTAAGAAPLFGPHTDFVGASSAINSVATADFDGDGIPDLATVDNVASNANVLYGTGTGSFGTNTGLSTGTGPNQVITGDFNRDGHPDLATANINGNSVSIITGTGFGFNPRTDFAAGGYAGSLTKADFDGDGDLDLAVVGYKPSPPPPYNPHLSILLNNGSGSFAAPINYTANTSPLYVVSADFNGDGHPDVAVANYDADNVSVFLGVGNGTFGPKTDFAATNGPGSLATGDFDRDGDQDLAVANFSADTVSVLLGTGTGSFAAKTDYATGVTPEGVDVADFNGDGIPDLVTSNFNSDTLSVLLGTGTGSFAAKQDFATAHGPLTVTTADFNGDGRMDTATGMIYTNKVSVLLGSGAPTATPGVGIHEFGEQRTGTASSSKVAELINQGNARLKVTGVQLVGDDPSEFEIRADSCSGQTIPVGQSCDVWIRFTPDTAGSKEASLRLTDNAPDSPQAVTLTGTGTTPPDPPVPDTTPPDVYFTSGPVGLTSQRTPAFGFAMNEPGTLECRVDGAMFTACTSPLTLTTLNDGNHSFEVRATDAAGNRSTVARNFSVDGTPPQTTLNPVISRVVLKKSRKARFSFRFSSQEPNATFACSIDGGAYAACESPLARSLGVGGHRFAVRATDLAGNTDSSPATASFKVKARKKSRKRHTN